MFRSCGSVVPASPSLRRVPMGRFPGLIGTTRCSDSLSSVPPHFVSFAWRYRVCDAIFVSPAGSQRQTRRPGIFLCGFPNRSIYAETKGPLEVPESTPICSCHVLRPRRTNRVRSFATKLILPSALATSSAPQSQNFRGSIARPVHSLSTLRRMDCSTTTQDSLPAADQLYRAGSLSRWVLSARFS